MTAEEIVARANAEGIHGQSAFLAWAATHGIDATDYDADGVMLFLGANGEPVLLFDHEARRWAVTHV